MDRELKLKAALWAVLISLAFTLAYQAGDACMPTHLPHEVTTVTTPAGHTLTIDFPGR